MKAVNELRVVVGFRCGKRDCFCVHWTCPECGLDGSIAANRVTPIFSATCENNPLSTFLVDWRTLIN